MQDRGAFMSINSSLQQTPAALQRWSADDRCSCHYSPLEHYNTLGYVIVVLSIISIFWSTVSRLVTGGKKDQAPSYRQRRLGRMSSYMPDFTKQRSNAIFLRTPVARVKGK
jgi:hypothetical protein